MIKAKTWRLIESGIGPADWNMALDEALLNGFREGDQPILRLYGWEPALSLGRFSSVHKSVDMERLEQQQLSCVRRMTGGGVLVHGGDLSYALVLPRKSLKDRGVRESYRYLCRFLIRLYEKLGQNAHFARDLQLEGGRSDICLADNEAYDIVIEGRKMGGNAQRHTRHILFQHGSIPMNVDESRFKPLFLGDSGLERAATLQRLGNEVAYEELAGLLRESFSETFDVNVAEENLRPSEEERAMELLTQKYSRQRWNINGE
ncbi:MAG: lipoate--protein ligase family protein [Campylobacterota bacterium]|nr:lipoate--protein ligase family protein [Campylobacterota bacterium]